MQENNVSAATGRACAAMEFVAAEPQKRRASLGKTEIAIPGDGATRLLLTAFLSVADQPRPDKPALVTLAFFAGDGTTLSGPFPGLNQSERYGTFCYINQPGAEGEFVCVRDIAVPPGTARVRAEAFAWHAKSAVLLEPLSLGLTAVPAERADQQTLGTVEAEVVAGEIYDVVLRWSGEQVAQPRFAVLMPRFEDAEGAAVAPPAYLAVSREIGPYRYFPPPPPRKSLGIRSLRGGECYCAGGRGALAWHGAALGRAR